MVIKDFKFLGIFNNDEDAEKDIDDYLLMADFNKKEVRTNCGDSYYDISLSFDDFIKFAKHIEERLKENENQS